LHNIAKRYKYIVVFQPVKDRFNSKTINQESIQLLSTEKQPLKCNTKNDMKRNLIYHTPIQLGESIAIRTNKIEAVHTELEAISRNGMTIKCNQKTLDLLLPNTASVAPKQSVALPVSFSLNQMKSVIDVQCNVVSVRRLSKDIFHLDMIFKEISAQNYESIDDYIESSLQRHQKQPHHKVTLAKVA